MISLDDFERGCRAFLDANAARRAEASIGPASVRLPLVGSAGEQVAAGMRRARAWSATCFDAGYGWITGPTRFGGRGLTSDHARLFQRLTVDYDVPDPMFTRTGVAIIGPTIERFGSDDMVADLLPMVHRGDVVLCQLYSEPGAGSDLASVSTRAEVDGDRIVINGQKVWSSGAAHSDVGACLVRVAGLSGRAALAMVLVDLRLPGVTIRPIVQMTGGQDFCEVFLDNVVVARSAMIGDIGDGWPIAVDTLSNERQAIGSELIPVDDIERVLRQRATGMDRMRRDLVMRTIVAARATALLSRRLAESADSSVAPLIKLSASQTLIEVAAALSSVVGVSLVASPSELTADAEVVCGVPGFRIGGGSDEVLRSMVAERVLGLPREPKV